MSKNERGIFQQIFKHFIASLKINQHKLIGEDYYGTKYYEIQKSNSSRNPRYFIPVNNDNHEQELPVEWEAWLRYRRKVPPSKEEIEKNYKLKMMIKQNSAQIEAKYSSNKSQKSTLHNKEYTSFPVYDEYKNYGQNYNIKYKKNKENND
ncbi:Mimitin [Apis cerana cerana]|uniref:Mimitin n=1 Tax=Apis cerana cerana TaxID=94128 RepID=A0A2A3ECB0_APICC|nr:Mimitin [Apis cerana cerana]